MNAAAEQHESKNPKVACPMYVVLTESMQRHVYKSFLRCRCVSFNHFKTELSCQTSFELSVDRISTNILPAKTHNKSHGMRELSVSSTLGGNLGHRRTAKVRNGLVCVYLCVVCMAVPVQPKCVMALCAFISV